MGADGVGAGESRELGADQPERFGALERAGEGTRDRKQAVAGPRGVGHPGGFRSRNPEPEYMTGRPMAIDATGIYAAREARVPQPRRAHFSNRADPRTSRSARVERVKDLLWSHPVVRGASRSA
jgi:hypothetical protein